MSRDHEFEQKIEILNQHVQVLQDLLVNLILRMNHDGDYPAATILKEIEALSDRADRNKDASPHRQQLLNQIARTLESADAWTPPSAQSPRT
jgi:uncharacterized protein YukE